MRSLEISSDVTMALEVCNEQDVSQELSRVLASSGFARNERMSKFLRFLVERHLQGRNDELKESLIAIEVFGRKPDYDPKQDSIVRTEAARLRSRLVEYYSNAGRSDSLVIEVPKGGYVPVFRRRAIADEQPRTIRSARHWFAAAIACAAIVSAAGGWWWLNHRNAPISVAVLPLQNLGPDSSDDYFADGLTDEIIRNLSVIDGLAVRSRTSSFVFKDRPRNVREAGRQLDAEYLVEGSVLRAGDRVRINAQIIRARDDLPVWSGRFDRKLAEVFTIQDEISLGIVNNLRLRLGRGRRRYETNAEAYDLYLRARTGTFIQPGAPSGIGEFEQAIAKDPSFAPAYAGLGSTYAIRSIQFPIEHSPDELSKMQAAAERAVELDPLLADAHEARALSYARTAQWAEAEKSFRDAITLDRNRAQTFVDYALWFLNVLGRNEEGLRQLRVAETSDPLSSEVQLATAWLQLSVGRYDEAARHCLRMAANNSLSATCSGRVRLGQGRISEAVQLFSGDPFISRNPQTRGFLGYALARLGDHDEAERMATASHFANEQALIYAGLGDKDRALDALNRMSVLGAQRVGQYLNFPELSLLQGDPRLNVLRTKVGLP